MPKPLFLLALLIAVAAHADYQLSNGYFSLHGQDGWFDQLRLDHAGKGKFGDNLIQSLSMGVLPGNSLNLKVEQNEDSIVLHDLIVRSPITKEYSYNTHPINLPKDSTLGVKFTVESGIITRVGGKFPTWHSADSGCTLTLYRLPDGDFARKEKIASTKLTNVKDNSEQYVDCDPQPPGTFYLEASEMTGTQIGWWGSTTDPNPAMIAYVDGKEQADMDLSVVYSGFTEVTGDWTVALEGPNLTSTFLSDALPPDIRVQIVTPWEKAGYDVSKFPFSRFYTDTGRHQIVQEYKRRPTQSIHASKWIYAMGNKACDLRFNLAPGQGLSWDFEDHSMTWKFNGSSLDIDLLRHNGKLPDSYPVFYSSQSKFDKVLNEFFYSHALNFGVGTPPDWKEWQALILDWTASPQKEEQRGHFTGVKMGENGYVFAWGAQEGWPFPYKDEDKDGKNDYDTRHFTTNPCFILGAYRYFAWTRDMDFLKEMMPKLRQAMAFDLNEVHGRDGILTIDAKGHEGRNDGIGSNYWDILPFGYKEAFCSSYFYEALRAMAELEQFCADRGLDLPGPKESPAFYQALRSKAQKAYNKTFWDDKKGRYVGCVDVDGVKHDYGFTFVNLEAMAYGLADQEQVRRVYRWMETEPTSTGKADTYSAWIFAPRANTIHNPPRDEAVNSKQSTVTSPASASPPSSTIDHGPSTIPHQPSALAPSPHRPIPPSPPPWWHFGWGGTDYGDQCQDGGAILYTSGYDVIARAKYLGADNAYQRLKEILDRYNMPDRLCGGSPMYRGEKTQGGPGGSAGSIGVEGEFPESGLAPASFLYAFLGIDADTKGLRICPNLPSSLKYAGVRNLSYAGTLYDIRVTNDSVEIKPLNVAGSVVIKRKLTPGETFVLSAGVVK